MCTRVLWNTDGRFVMAGRTMDWPESTQPTIVAFPRGRDGGKVGAVVAVDDNPLRWTSRDLLAIFLDGTKFVLHQFAILGPRTGAHTEADAVGDRHPVEPGSLGRLGSRM